MFTDPNGADYRNKTLGDKAGTNSRMESFVNDRRMPVEFPDYVVFGGTGDFAYRKLLSAVYHRFRDGQIPE